MTSPQQNQNPPAPDEKSGLTDDNVHGLWLLALAVPIITVIVILANALGS